MRQALLLGILCASCLSAPADYFEKYERGVAECEKIDSDDYQTGLWLNPDGFRSFYKQSACFQELAEQARDIELCDRVRRRWALFSSSWGVSESHCEKLVTRAIAGDHARLESLRRRYEAGPHRLTALRVEKNGNGRDYDIIPAFTEVGFNHPYHLAVYFVEDGNRYLLTENGFYLSGDNRIRMFEYQRDIRSRFPRFRPGRNYSLEAVVTLSIGEGSHRGWWHPEFIEEVFPVATREQRMQLSATF